MKTGSPSRSELHFDAHISSSDAAVQKQYSPFLYCQTTKSTPNHCFHMSRRGREIPRSEEGGFPMVSGSNLLSLTVSRMSITRISSEITARTVFPKSAGTIGEQIIVLMHLYLGHVPLSLFTFTDGKHRINDGKRHDHDDERIIRERM